MIHFTLIFHIQVIRLSFSIFGNFCKNWVLKLILDYIKISRNSSIKVIRAGHMGTI